MNITNNHFDDASKERIKNKVLFNLIPLKHLKHTFFTLALLTISPLIIILNIPSIIQDEILFNWIIGTLCILTILDSILAFGLLVVFKNPYMSEWKDRLGYK